MFLQFFPMPRNLLSSNEERAPVALGTLADARLGQAGTCPGAIATLTAQQPVASYTLA
jgi:hypothetical protein